MDLSKAVYTVREVMQIARVGKTTLYKLIDSGDIKVQKFRNRTLITKEDLAAYFAKLPDWAREALEKDELPKKGVAHGE